MHADVYLIPMARMFNQASWKSTTYLPLQWSTGASQQEWAFLGGKMIFTMTKSIMVAELEHDPILHWFTILTMHNCRTVQVRIGADRTARRGVAAQIKQRNTRKPNAIQCRGKKGRRWVKIASEKPIFLNVKKAALTQSEAMFCGSPRFAYISLAS